MKLIKAYIHHVRVPDVIDALADAGYRNFTLHDVKGVLRAVSECEHDYSTEGGASVISEARLSLVVEDQEIAAATNLIRRAARIGTDVSGYIYISAVEQMLPIGGPDDPTGSTGG